MWMVSAHHTWAGAWWPGVLGAIIWERGGQPFGLRGFGSVFGCLLPTTCQPRATHWVTHGPHTWGLPTWHHGAIVFGWPRCDHVDDLVATTFDLEIYKINYKMMVRANTTRGQGLGGWGYRCDNLRAGWPALRFEGFRFGFWMIADDCTGYSREGYPRGTTLRSRMTTLRSRCWPRFDLKFIK